MDPSNPPPPPPNCAAARLRAALAKPGLVSMPCCYDALSARLVEAAGFEATFVGGFSVSAAQFGKPDTGQINLTDMVRKGREIAGAVDIPVFGDADTGWGGPVNVRATVRAYARAGYAGIMLGYAALALLGLRFFPPAWTTTPADAAA